MNNFQLLRYELAKSQELDLQEEQLKKRRNEYRRTKKIR